MMKIKNGDYVPDGLGGFSRAEGYEALLERIRFRLTAKRGAFPFLDTLGSQLCTLGQFPPSERISAAEQFAAEALSDEEGLTVQAVTVEMAEEGGCTVTVELEYGGEDLSVAVDVQ